MNFDDWADSRDGRLALILLLDQMSRNLKRGTPDMFAADAKALALAAKAIELGDDDCEPSVKRWYYMPFMHSEKLADQDRCVELCRQPGLEGNPALCHRPPRHHCPVRPLPAPQQIAGTNHDCRRTGVSGRRRPF